MILRARFSFALLLATGMLVSTSCSTASGSATATASIHAATTRCIYDVRSLVFTSSANSEAWISLPLLIDNLKQVTDPALWNSPGFQIQAEESGYLIVDASAGMHERVAMVLT